MQVMAPDHKIAENHAIFPETCCFKKPGRSGFFIFSVVGHLLPGMNDANNLQSEK
jgi:hypothetical protein